MNHPSLRSCCLLMMLWIFVLVNPRAHAQTEGAGASGEAMPRPDLTNFDADTLRVLANRLYGMVGDLQKKLKAATQDLNTLRGENRDLKAANGHLQERVNKLQEEVAELRLKTAPPPASTLPAEPEARKIPNPTAVERELLKQAPPFRTLNASPQEYLGKHVVLYGYAEMSDHESKGMFNDQTTPRQFIALTDLNGDRIFVSFPRQGNDKLFHLLDRDRGQRTALKIDAAGISTRSNTAFEAAGSKWQTIEP